MALSFNEPPESLCILRLSALGDVTHVVPVVNCLQRSWPNTKLTWIIGKPEASLVGDLPGVEFIIFDKSRGWRALLDLKKSLANRQFDLLFHMQAALRASLASTLVKAPIRLGFDKERARNGQGWFITDRIEAAPRQHVLDGFLGFLNAVGVDTTELSWNIPIPDDAVRFANNALSIAGPILAINPCSSQRARNWRNWPSSRYATIADYAYNERGFHVVLTGGPAERERAVAEEIIQMASSPIVNLVGKTSLKQLLAVLQRASILIAPDTGPAHMATTVGTPVIGLFATSNPRRTGPYRSLNSAINKYPEALRRYESKSEESAKWGERVRHPEAMELISVGDVINQINKLATYTEGTH